MSTPAGLSRRQLLELAAAAGLTATWAHAAEQPTASAPARDGDGPRSVIFMVADGMSIGIPSLAEPFSQLVRGRGTRWFELLQDPHSVQGLFQTSSLDSMVTDSAAAASAWGSGARVFNGSINALPDGTRLTPLAPLVRDTRRRFGLVSTATITHATPAGFAAVQPEREDQNLIAPQYLDLVDVALGGGVEFFDPARREDKRDLYADFAAKGYAVWRDREAMLAAGQPEKALGVFSSGHMPFVLDIRQSEELQRTTPTLAEMTRKALDLLDAAPHGFVLQVEGGRVDHCAHNNDAAGILWEQLAFDEAIDVVMGYVAAHRDTLVIITADHGNSNPGLVGMGGAYRDSTRYFERLAGATASMEKMCQRLREMKGTDDDAVREYLRTAAGITVKPEEAAIVRTAFAEKVPPELNRQHANRVGLLGQILGNHNGIQWNAISHTDDLVIATAYGPGAARFAGLLPHAVVFDRIATLLDIPYRNPQMTAEQARKYLPRAAVDTPPHWLT